MSERSFSLDEPTPKIILFAMILLWTLGIFINHLIHAFDQLLFLLPFLERSYSTVCHRDPAKLLAVGGIDTMVCSRCAGIYIGFFILSFSMFLRIKRFNVPFKLFLFAAILTLTDIALVMLNVIAYSKISAFITGFLLGSIGFSYFYGGIQNLLSEITTDREN